MDSIRVAPSATFTKVLEELHTIPGAPKSIVKFFKPEDITVVEKDIESNGEAEEKLESEDEKLVSKIEEITPDKGINSSDEDTESDHFPGCDLLLRTSDVKWCHEQMRKKGLKHRIHELINESEVLFPKIISKERDPALDDRISKLRAQQQNREYQSMTSNLRYQSGNQGAWSGVGREMREMHSEINRQLIAGIQYIVSIVGTFFALFVGMSFYDSNLSTRIVVSLIGAITVGIAELYFIVREDMRSEADQKKKK